LAAKEFAEELALAPSGAKTLTEREGLIAALESVAIRKGEFFS
jgi:hypothetical protein